MSFDAYTKLVSHFNGVDAATTYTAETGQIISFVGTAQLDTAQKQFGASSLLLDGNSDWVTVPDSDDWYFGTGDFTLECWVRFNSSSAGVQIFMSQYQDATHWWYFDKDAGGLMQLAFQYGAGYQGYVYLQSALTWNTGQWYHVAAVRNGSTAYLFRDGISLPITVHTSFGTNDVGNLSVPLAIGSYNSLYWFNGWIDEPRISKGVARWTANFTPPTVEYAENINLSGSVKNNNLEGISGVTITLDGNGSSPTTITDANGDFNFNDIAVPFDYTLTPSAIVGGYFNPSSYAYTPLNGGLPNQDFTLYISTSIIKRTALFIQAFIGKTEEICFYALRIIQNMIVRGTLTVTGQTTIDTALTGIIKGTAGVLSAITAGTANQVLGINNAGNGYEYKTIEGTANQVSVSLGVANKITLSTPQNIHSGASPTFAGLTLTTFAGLLKATAGVISALALGAANRVLGVNAAGNDYEYKDIVGTSNRITVAHTANTITLSAPQDIHSGATPEFAGVNLGDTNFNDYKEGTWTPKLYAGGNEITSYYHQAGFYTRIGRVVYINCQITINQVGAVTGGLTIQNLPYTSSSATRNRSVAVLGGSSITGLTGQHLYGWIEAGTTWYDLLYMNGTSGVSLDQSNLDAEDTTFFLTGFYII